MDSPFQDQEQQRKSRQQREEEHKRAQQAAGYDNGRDPITPSPPPVRPSRVTFFSPNPDRADGQSISSIGLGINQSSHSPGYSRLQSRDPSPPSSKSQFQTHDYMYDMSRTPNTPEFYHSQYDHNGREKPPAYKTGSSWAWLNAPWVMYFAFCAGVVFAGGHHIFYDKLDGKPADDQIRMMRFGGLLSYAAKASLVSSCVFAFRQQVWLTVRRKHLRLQTIDSIFSASQDITALFNWEFLKKAKVSVFLVLVLW